MDIFIIEDHRKHYDQTRNLISKAFPNAKVYDTGTFNDWDRAYEVARKQIQDKQDVLVLLDLAITAGEPMEAAKVALNFVPYFRQLLPQGTLVAFTQLDPGSEGKQLDGVIAKLKVFDGPTEDERVLRLRRAVGDVMKRRAGRKGFDVPGKSNVRFHDSVGFRTAQAAIGEELLAAIVQRETENWDHVEVRALTSGYGGAHVLLLKGQQKQGQMGLVLKCTRDRLVIEHEIKATNKYLPSLGAFGSHFAATSLELREFDGIFYYCQTHIGGRSILELCSEADFSTPARLAIQTIIDIELDHYKGKSFTMISPAVAYTLLPIDVHRAMESLPILFDFTEVVVEIGQWPKRLPAPRTIVAGVREVVVNWYQSMMKQQELCQVVQHGDLNPNNILVSGRHEITMIDLARLREWPVGYDLSRLSALLRLRLTDRVQGRDWIVCNLNQWLDDEFAAFKSKVGTAWCKPSAKCDKAFMKYASTHKMRIHLMRGYSLSTIWDLLKALSYADLSHFKRIWVLVEIWRLANKVELIK